MKVSQVEAGGRGGSSTKKKRCSVDGFSAPLKLVSLFMDVFELSPCCLCRFCCSCSFLSVFSKSFFSKFSTFIDSFWYFVLQAIFPLFPDGHLRVAFHPDQHTSGCSLLEQRLCCSAGSPELSLFTDLEPLRSSFLPFQAGLL